MTLVLYIGPRKEREKKEVTKIKWEKLQTAQDLFSKYSTNQLKNWKSLDLYYLLGLPQEEAAALTESGYKMKYRKQAKILHPDMLLSANINDQGAAFMALTRAYQTLSNPVKRKQYDCIAFDASIPEDRAYTPEEFFLVFRPVFERNAIYSMRPCVVSLGGPETPDQDVQNFYRFWRSFESSRSFEFLCENEDCKNRDERRHVVKQNKEMLEKKKAEDTIRLRKLVSLAAKNDPRVSRKAPAQVSAAKITIDSEGWKSTEVESLEKLAAEFTVNKRNRLELIYAVFSRHFPSRSKKDVQKKLLKIDLAQRKANNYKK